MIAADTENEQVDEEVAGAPPIQTLRLVWSEGRAPSYAIVTLRLGRNVIGRASLEGGVLNRKVSKQHAVVHLGAAGGVQVTPVRNRLLRLNRTTLNGRLVEKQETVEEQAVLKTGHALWVYEIEPAALAPPADPAGSRSSVRMRMFDAQIRRMAPTRDPILIVGATGTGKERVAQSIHEMSGRSTGPFVTINCAAIAPTLLESELFGHARGAFTGATGDRRGRFEQANGGTLFLDEFGELSLAGQASILRALEERAVWRIGGKSKTPVDVRVVAATNRDLAEMVRKETYRSDLLFRLTYKVTLPSLCQRLADLWPLVNEIWLEWNELVPAFSPDAIQELFTHSWPGNVRELRSRMAQLRLLIQDDRQQMITAQMVRGVLQEDSAKIERATRAPPMDLKNLDASALLGLLQRQGSIRGAARALSVNHSKVARRMHELGITIEDFRD